MDTSARLLRLLSLLQARPTWSGPDLAHRLGVTARTLRRDIDRLRGLGYPVSAMPGRYGGYRLTAGGAIPPLLLDDDEAVAVALGLRAAAGSVPGLEDATLSALAKIEKVFPPRLRSRLEAVEGATVSLSGVASSGPAIDPELLGLVAQACTGPERLRFEYTDASGSITQRHVEPLKLVRTGRRWYLVARDRDRDAWRTFRVDRMRRAVATGMRVVHQDPPHAEDLVSEGLSVAVWPVRAKVLLRVSLQRATRLISPMVGRLEPHPEGALLRIGADDAAWIARFLANLPCEFSILEPDEVREALRALAQRLEGA